MRHEIAAAMLSAAVCSAAQDRLEETRTRVNLAPHNPKLTCGDVRAGAFDSFMASAIERMYEELHAR